MDSRHTMAGDCIVWPEDAGQKRPSSVTKLQPATDALFRLKAKIQLSSWTTWSLLLEI